MSKCWKCNKEFYSENLIRTLCDECLEKIPKTTATTDFGNLLNSEIKDLVDDFSKRKISELEAKLEEKEKEIKNLVLAHFENEINKPVLTTTQMINQDKISFAIQQLEKVKEFVKENESWEIEGNDYSIVYADDVLDQIDNQIEELKKEIK